MDFKGIFKGSEVIFVDLRRSLRASSSASSSVTVGRSLGRLANNGELGARSRRPSQTAAGRVGAACSRMVPCLGPGGAKELHPSRV